MGGNEHDDDPVEDVRDDQSIGTEVHDVLRVWPGWRELVLVLAGPGCGVGLSRGTSA